MKMFIFMYMFLYPVLGRRTALQNSERSIELTATRVVDGNQFRNFFKGIRTIHGLSIATSHNGSETTCYLGINCQGMAEEEDSCLHLLLMGFLKTSGG